MLIDGQGSGAFQPTLVNMTKDLLRFVSAEISLKNVVILASILIFIL